MSQQLNYVLITQYCLYLQEYKYVASKRLSYFHSSKPQPHQFTILVHSIPTSSSCSISDTVESFFREFYPSTYLSHVVIRRTSKIRSLLVSILLNFNSLSCSLISFLYVYAFLETFAKGLQNFLAFSTVLDVYAFDYSI